MKEDQSGLEIPTRKGRFSGSYFWGEQDLRKNMRKDKFLRFPFCVTQRHTLPQ